MADEIIKTAEAIQEVAKTTGKAIEVVDRIGAFFARVMHESIEATCGMLSDTLKYKRWQRQIALIEKAEDLIAKKGLTDSTRVIKPKIALPIFQYASLEDNETLHDIWVKLFVTALDPNCPEPHTVFIDIIRQLEPIDVKVLNVIYENSLQKREEEKMHARQRLMSSIGVRNHFSKETFGQDRIEEMLRKSDLRIDNHHSTTLSCDRFKITNTLNIGENSYRFSIDNLIRQRLIASYIRQIDTDYDGSQRGPTVSMDHGYNAVCITELGISFVESCIPEKLTSVSERGGALRIDRSLRTDCYLSKPYNTKLLFFISWDFHQHIT